MDVLSDLLQGTLDLLVLKSLAPEALHGMGIARRFSQITSGTFTVKAGSPLSNQVVILSDSTWRQLFGGRSNIVAKQLTLNNANYTVVGILPLPSQRRSVSGVTRVAIRSALADQVLGFVPARPLFVGEAKSLPADLLPEVPDSRLSGIRSNLVVASSANRPSRSIVRAPMIRPTRPKSLRPSRELP